MNSKQDRPFLSKFRLLTILFFIAMVTTPAKATIDSGVTGLQMALAMGIPAANIVSASMTNLNNSGTADTRGFGIQVGTLGNNFPTESGSFIVLTSGNVADIPGANDATGVTFDQGTQFGSGAESNGDDVVSLRITIKPPDTALSFHFDHVFLSEEFPEFVGSAFNDFFIFQSAVTPVTVTFAQVGGATGPVASDNVIFDNNGGIMSVNNNFFDPNTAQVTGTEFDGQTPLLLTCAPIPTSGGKPFTIVLSVGDVGDASLMSAAFVDNFQFSDEPITKAVTADPAAGTQLGVSADEALTVYTFPNPYVSHGNSVTFTIDLQQCIATTRITSVEIFDITGRRIRLLGGSTGRTLTWDGRNSRGKLVGSGVYFYRLKDSQSRVGKSRMTIIN